MKKRVLLLITLVVSLFIYSSSVNAIVMWMQCTDTAEGDMAYNSEVGNSSDYFKKYNTFAVINNYHSHGTSIKHVLYAGGTDSEGRSKNFFEFEGPTFMMNFDNRSEQNDDKVCWYQKEGAGENKIGEDHWGGYLTECDENDETINPFIDVANLSDGICPVSVYQTTGGNTAGSTKGNFVVMIGSKKASSSNVELLNGYKLALYQAKTTRYNGDEITFWIIEVYNNNGIYGNLIAVEDIANNNLLSVYRDFFHLRFCSKEINYKEPRSGILDTQITVCGDTSWNNHGDEHYVYDSDYVDYNQIIQLIKLYYTGRNYFKLTEYEKYPEVLIANIGGYKDENPKLSIDSSVHSYEKGKEVWDETNKWKEIIGTSLGSQSETFSKFFERGEYYNLITEAEKVSESISSGKKYNLNTDSDGNIENIDGIISQLNGSYADIDNLLGKEFGYPTYKKSDIGTGLGNCIQDGFTTDAAYSLSDYVSCSTIGVPINYVAENYIGKNTSVVISTFESAMADQIKKITGNNSELLNVNSKLKGYIINLSKYISYIRKNYSDKLSDDQKRELDDILSKYLQLARNEFQIEIVVDCDTLLGEDFINKIEKYVNFIKIAIPIILIGYGIYDFASAVFAGDADKMKKAQKKFIMRIVISILFFLLPFIIKIILSIANKAWSFISPSGCNFL